LVLLADFFNLRAIAFGTPIDNTWLKYGREFRDFRESYFWKYWTRQFAKAGLAYVLPINHISEAGALEICKKSKLLVVVNSCLRGVSGSWCGECWKCFHKNGPLGRKINPQSKEITEFLNTSPLRTAQHVLWTIQHQGMEDLVPRLKKHLTDDLSWWIKAYSPGIDLCEGPWQDTIYKITTGLLRFMDATYKLERVNLQL